MPFYAILVLILLFIPLQGAIIWILAFNIIGVSIQIDLDICMYLYIYYPVLSYLNSVAFKEKAKCCYSKYYISRNSDQGYIGTNRLMIELNCKGIQARLSEVSFLSFCKYEIFI